MPATRRCSFSLLAILWGVLCSGCPAPSDPKPSQRNDRPVVTDLGADPLTLEFARWRDQSSRRIVHLIGDTLVSYSRRLEPQPRVAEAWSQSPDGLEWTFRLRTDARWHDGRPVTAQDIVHTWQVMKDPQRSVAFRAVQFAPIRQVDALDARTVVMRLDHPYPSLLNTWATNALIPAHGAGSPEHPLGCGPWKLASWTRGQAIELVANDDHFEPPQIRRLRFEILQDYNVRFQALVAGKTDLTSLHPDLAVTKGEDPEFKQQFELLDQRSLFLFYIAWRTSSPQRYLADPRVRRALTQAIDRPSFLRSIARGLALPGRSYIHPDQLEYDPSIEPWPYDPPAAAAALDAAGCPVGPRGTRACSGQPMRLTVIYGPNPEAERIAVFLQAELAKLGIELIGQSLPNAELFERIAQRRYDAVLTGTYLDPPADPYDLLHSSQAGTGSNYSDLKDPTIDQLLEAGRRAIDRGAQRALSHQLQQKLHQLEPVTVLYYPVSRIAIRKGLKGVESSPLFWEWRPGVSGWSWESSAP
jgi:peptide/nickel transport system substrate-binding protein